MRIHDVLYAIHPWLTWPGFASVMIATSCAAAIGLAALLRNPPIRHPQWANVLLGFGIASLTGLAVLQFGIAAIYPIYPSYLDWAEPRTAAIAWLALHGSPAYPPIGAGDLYAHPYGPFLLDVTGWGLKILGPTIANSKIPSLLAFATAQLFTYVALRRFGGTRIEALTIAAAQCVIQAGFTNQAIAFGVRADPWLFLIGSAGALVATFRPSWKSLVLFGVLAGIAANLKLYAAVFVAPTALFVVCDKNSSTLRVRMAVSGLAAFIVAFTLPFAGVDLANYFAIVELSSHRHTVRWLLEADVMMMLFLLAAPAWIYVFHRPKMPTQFHVFFISTLVCMLLVLYPASKGGAGPYHLLPFLPSISLSFVALFRAARERTRPVTPLIGLDASALVLIVSVLLGYGPIVAQSWDYTLRSYGNAPAVWEALHEIGSILDKKPSLKIAMGPSRNQSSDPSTYLQVIPVFNGNPLAIDPMTFQDFADYGRVDLRDAPVRRLLRECRVDLWLLPRGSGFGSGLKAEQASFGDVDFRETHDLVETGKVFEQWRCRGKPGAGLPRSPEQN